MNAHKAIRTIRFVVERAIVSCEMNMIKNSRIRDAAVKSGLLFRGRSPHAVMLSLTDRCQCSCRHCGVATNGTKDELSTREIFSLIDTLKKRKVMVLCLFGGEPLLRVDLDAIIRYARKRGMRLEMDSNGEFLTRERIRQLREAGLDLVRISLDSTVPAEHNRSRARDGLFEKVMEAVVWCRQEQLECQLSNYVSRENINSGGVERMVNLAAELGVRVRLLKPVLSGNLIDAEHEKLAPVEMARLRKNLSPKRAYLEVDWVDDPRKHFLCAAKLKKNIFISSSGDVQPCCYLPVKFGNIRDESLETIIARMYHSVLFDGDVWECPMSKREFRETWCGKEYEKCA